MKLVTDLTTMSLSQLVELYNDYAENKVAKFATKPVAVTRVERLRDRNEAVVFLTDGGTYAMMPSADWSADETDLVVSEALKDEQVADAAPALSQEDAALAAADAAKFEYGDRVVLSAFEDEPEKRGTVLEVWRNGTYAVQLDAVHVAEAGDDGVREVAEDQLSAEPTREDDEAELATLAEQEDAALASGVEGVPVIFENLRDTEYGEANAASWKAENGGPVKSGKRGPAAEHGDDEKITVLVSSNPKRAGSKSAERFALYAYALTVSQYLNSAAAVQGGKPEKYRADLHWDVKHGFVRIG